MFILLLTLLGIALTITFAGLFLSSRMQAPPKQEISYVGRNASGKRGRERSYVVRHEMLHGDTAVAPARGRRYASNVVTRRSLSGVFASFNIGEALGARVGKQTHWMGIILILLALFGFSLFSLRALLLNPGLVFNLSMPDTTTTSSNAAANKAPTNTSPFSGLAGASKALIRVNQLDPAQYATNQEYSTWAFSTCSAASMTEVINSYGHNYRITDILKVESGIGEITPALGLLEPQGIDKTAAHFGFKTTWLNNTNLDQVINVGNQGRPVIVSFPPSRWDGGHILVVRGGNSQSVYLADSSRLNMQVMSRPTFMKYWAGFAVVIVPNN